MKYFYSVFVLLISFTIILSGCQSDKNTNQNVEYYSTVSDVDEMVSAMQNYKTDKISDKYNNYPSCYATNYKMDLLLNSEQKKLSGDIIISFNNNTDDTLQKLCIRLYSASTLKAEKMNTNVISKAAINNRQTQVPVKQGDDPSVIYIDLSGNEVLPHKTGELYITYESDIPKTDSRFGYHADGENLIFNLSLCYPLLSMYKDGGWNESPAIESGAESNFNKIAHYDVTFQTDEEYTVAASGEETTSGKTTKIVGDNLREMAVFASNYFKCDTVKTESGITVNNYYPDYECKKYYDYALLSACDSIEMYQKLFGEYGFDELDIVHTFYSSAMEFPGIIMIGFPDVDYNNINTAIVSDYYPSLCSRTAHEVAHQWFYAMVGSDPYNEPFLDEGFAEYCEDVLYLRSGCDSLKKAVAEAKNNGSFEYTQTQKEFDKYMQGYITQIAGKKFIINYPYNKYKKDEYSMHAYEGGKMFLYELRNSMGNSAFFYALKEYCAKYKFKESTTKDFVETIKLFDSSNKTNKILDKYIEIR